MRSGRAAKSPRPVVLAPLLSPFGLCSSESLLSPPGILPVYLVGKHFGCQPGGIVDDNAWQIRHVYEAKGKFRGVVFYNKIITKLRDYRLTYNTSIIAGNDLDVLLGNLSGLLMGGLS